MMQEHHAYTFAHSLRVAILMAAYGRHLGLDDDHVKLLAETGLAHDVRKQRIPIAILAKPVRLTDAEMAVMRTHATLGAEMRGGLSPDHQLGSDSGREILCQSVSLTRVGGT